MAGKSVSGYVDETVATRLAALARAEARTPASVVGQATSFYVRLPEMARSALRRIDHLAADQEKRWLESEMVRLLMRADFAMTQRLLAEEMAAAIPDPMDEEAAEAAALEWTAPRS